MLLHRLLLVSRRLQPGISQLRLQHAAASSRLEVDSWGAVSSIPDHDPVPHLRTPVERDPQQQQGSTYTNHDGLRHDDGRYQAFLRDAGICQPAAARICRSLCDP